MAGVTRVVVVEDEAVSGLGIAALLAEAGVELVRASETPEAAVSLARRTRPDLVVCDVMFGGHPRGLDLPAMLRAAGADVPVLHLSSWDMPYLVRRARQAGAVGYVLKTAGLPRLRAAIEAVRAGHPAFPPEGVAQRPPTELELEVLRHVAAGWPSRAIAERLAMSPRTVEGCLGRLFDRYGVDDRTRLATLAYERGWVMPSDIEDIGAAG